MSGTLAQTHMHIAPVALPNQTVGPRRGLALGVSMGLQPSRQRSRYGALTRSRGYTKLSLPTVSYAGLLTARVFKHDERLGFLPLDLTILFALLVIWFCFHAVVRDPSLLRVKAREMLLILMLFATFAFGLFQMPGSSYSSQKVAGIYTFALIASAAPFFIVRSSRERRAFLNAILLFGTLMGIQTLVLITGGSGTGRLSPFGDVPIWSGRLAGAALIVSFSRFVSRQMTIIAITLIAGILGVALAASGSRGPLLALALALLGVAVYASREQAATRRRVVISIMLLLMVTGTIVSLVVPNSRLAAYTFDGGFADADRVRLDLNKAAIEGLINNPLGTGWGSFVHTLGRFNSEALERNQIGDNVYPHNLYLEVSLEAGWLAGLAFVTLVLTALHRAFRANPSGDNIALLALLLYYMTNAAFSGDINSNRYLFALIAICLTAFPPSGSLGRRKLEQAEYIPGSTRTQPRASSSAKTSRP